MQFSCIQSRDKAQAPLPGASFLVLSPLFELHVWPGLSGSPTCSQTEVRTVVQQPEALGHNSDHFNSNMRTTATLYSFTLLRRYKHQNS